MDETNVKAGKRKKFRKERKRGYLEITKSRKTLFSWRTKQVFPLWWQWVAVSWPKSKREEEVVSPGPLKPGAFYLLGTYCVPGTTLHAWVTAAAVDKTNSWRSINSNAGS